MSQASLFDVMYGAGLFEGEGCVLIHRGGRKPFGSFSLEAIINMCDPEPVAKMESIWGGTLRNHRQHRGVGRRVYHWGNPSEA
ncbi:MAG TPA: hypothetical protein DEV93_13635 [Chloroflexi bacterium]|jgi:hypothetical protein|nr:hypothetical protein [Chloroflexota bacterium]